MNKYRSGPAAAAGALSVLALCTSVPAATPYSFANIADSNGPFASFNDRAAALSDNGNIVFKAILDGGGAGLFKGANPATDTVADVTGPFAAQSFNFFDINNAGTVVFDARLDVDASVGIFTGPNPTADKLADTSGPYSDVHTPSINNTGTVIFRAVLDTGGHGIFRGPIPATDTIARNTAAGGLHPVINSRPDYNDAGTPAFVNVTGGIYRGPDPVVDAYVTSAGPFDSYGTDPSINNNGVIAFLGFLDSGVNGVYTGPDPLADRVADSTGAYNLLGHSNSVDINDSGVVAFFATLDAGGSGIFTGDDPLADKVIRTGDTLFGGTVTGLTFYRGLDNNGNVAFGYTLNDGRSGIAMAQLPEPTAATLSAVGSAMLLCRRRR